LPPVWVNISITIFGPIAATAQSSDLSGIRSGFTPKADGGNEQHPIHDEDQEDATPDDYEREIDRLDEAVRARSR
jgi:hypothetical protein